MKTTIRTSLRLEIELALIPIVLALSWLLATWGDAVDGLTIQ